MPKFLIEASFTTQGVKGFRAKEGPRAQARPAGEHKRGARAAIPDVCGLDSHRLELHARS